MKFTRRVHPLLSACAGFALFACAGNIDTSYGEAPTPDDSLSAAPYDGDEAGEVDVASAELRRSRRRSSTTTTPTTTTPTAPTTSQPVVTQPTAPVTTQPASVAWSDSIQTSTSGTFGFNQITLERPIGSTMSGSSECNLTRVASPDGNGYALKHVATFDDNGGSRAQAGIYSFANKTFNDLAKSSTGVYVAQQWYFPQSLRAGDLGSRPWANLWDWHSVGPNGANRWDTQPGLMVAQDGSMRVKWSWRQQNQETAWSTVNLPVGRWFEVEMHYVWTASGATVSLWIDGKLALEQTGVKTKDASHTSIETYMKFYGSANSGPSWGNGGASVKYTRNVRLSGQRIGR